MPKNAIIKRIYSIVLKRIIFALCFAFFIGLVLIISPKPVSAMPSTPGQLVITQPDGCQFDAQLWGDERASGFETLSGYSIQQGGRRLVDLPTANPDKQSTFSLQ